MVVYLYTKINNKIVNKAIWINKKQNKDNNKNDR